MRNGFVRRRWLHHRNRRREIGCGTRARRRRVAAQRQRPLLRALLALGGVTPIAGVKAAEVDGGLLSVASRLGAILAAHAATTATAAPATSSAARATAAIIALRTSAFAPLDLRCAFRGRPGGTAALGRRALGMWPPLACTFTGALARAITLAAVLAMPVPARVTTLGAPRSTLTVALLAAALTVTIATALMAAIVALRAVSAAATAAAGRR